MHVATIVVLFGVAGAVWLLVFPILGTALKDKWGINLHRVSCPSCDAPMPRIRIPASIEQALLGGWTCPRCHCQIDKWGRKISSNPSDNKVNH